MSGLLFLSSEDFFIQKFNKVNLLCNNIVGLSLVLFYSNACKFCKNLIPIFKQLPDTVNGCQFAMMNVSNNKQCIVMSTSTTSPIKVVPYVILYMNGKPYMRYQGPHDIREITKFIVEMAKKINESQRDNQAVQRAPNQQQGATALNHRPIPHKIPEYTIGKPLCGDDEVCYLDVEEAYEPELRKKCAMPKQAGMM